MLRASKQEEPAFQSPSFEELIRLSINVIRAQYIASGGINAERLELISALEAFHISLEKIKQSNVANKPKNQELQDVSIGIWICWLEYISSTYPVLYVDGSYINAGSILYKILYQHLAINDQNPLSNVQMLKYMSKAYKFIFDNNFDIKIPEARFDIELLRKGLDQERIRKRMIEGMTFVINSKPISPFTGCLLRAMPVEASTDFSMLHMDAHYLVKRRNKINPERLLQARIARALALKMPAKKEVKGQAFDPFMNDAEKIKRAWLIYIMISIESEKIYMLRSPRGNSALYDFCCDALNVESSENIDSKTKISCLAELHGYLLDYNKKKELEAVLNDPKNYPNQKIERTEINVVMRTVPGKIEGMINNFENPNKFAISKTTIAAATIGAILMTFPGYAAGSAVGYAISLTDGATIPKAALTSVTGHVMNLVLGESGVYLKYYASGLVVDAASQRICAKVLEAIAAVIGAVSGGAISIVLTEITPKAVTELVALFTHIYTTVDPNLAKAVDPEFLECLLQLPDEVFSVKDKEKVRHVTTFGLFPPAQEAMFADAEPAPASEYHFIPQ